MPFRRRPLLVVALATLTLAACNVQPRPPVVPQVSERPALHGLQLELPGTRLTPDSGSPEAQALQAQALRDVGHDKRGPLTKVGLSLARTYRVHQAQAQGLLSPQATGPAASTVTVDAVASDDAGTLLADLQALGLQHGTQFGRVVSGRLPIDAIPDAAALGSLLQMRPSLAITHAGLVTSEARHAVRVDDVQRKLHLDGSGVTVGILSDSFARIGTPGCPAAPGQGIHQADGSYAVTSYADDVASGDLPAGVDILDDSAACGGPGDLIDEGRAMAQLVHDLAPGSDLAFHEGFNGQADFAQGVLDLADAGANVIVDDIGYLAEPMFQDGIIAQAIDEVAGRGVAYFSSAGNDADRSYASPFRDSGVEAVVGGEQVGTFHDWDPGPGTQLCQTFNVQAGQDIFPVLEWDQPFASSSVASPGSSSDVDLYLTDANCNILTGSYDDNMGGDPVEGFDVRSGVSGVYGLAIVLFDGPAPGLLKYVDYGSASGPFDPPLGAGTSYGHSNATGGLGVAAAFYGDTPKFGSRPRLEPFSSKGGVPVLFDVAGNRLATPEVRQQPDITAPDGTNTTFFYSDSARDDDNGDGTFVTREVGEFPNFFGTSAAAPHAAAVAALMRQADPTLTPRQTYDLMERTAQNIGPHRADEEAGWGLVDAYTAVRRAARH